jgi:hypothetical protein
MGATMEVLSGSTDGKRIKVAATATPGTLIHTGHATSQDRIFANVNNSSTSPVNLTVEFGGVADPDDLIHVTVPAKFTGLMQIVAGDIMTNSKVVRAFAGSANVLTIGGYVLRG